MRRTRALFAAAFAAAAVSVAPVAASQTQKRASSNSGKYQSSSTGGVAAGDLDPLSAGRQRDRGQAREALYRRLLDERLPVLFRLQARRKRLAEALEKRTGKRVRAFRPRDLTDPKMVRLDIRRLRIDIRVLKERLQRAFPRPPAWARAKLEAIAWCESRGNPRAVSGNGTYRGKYQFSLATWRSVGGRGDPAAASEAEQDWRAWLLMRRDGTGHWPVCG